MVRAMNDDAQDQIAQLGTEIAMIMEDVIDSALTLGAAEREQRRGRLEELRRAATRIASLIDEAIALED